MKVSCNSFGSVSTIIFISSPFVVKNLGVKKKASALMTLAVQQRIHFGCCCTKRLRLRHKASASSPSVTHKWGSSRQRDVRTVASIYAGQERVDEELHVLPLNYHAPTASGHNGPWCNLRCPFRDKTNGKDCLRTRCDKRVRHMMQNIRCKLMLGMIPAHNSTYLMHMHMRARMHAHRGRYFGCGVNDLSGQGPSKGSQDETAALWGRNTMR